MIRLLFSLLITPFTVSACTWVQLAPEGEVVKVASALDVQSCTKKGSTTVNLKSKIAGFDRSKKKVKTELETLARNSATELGGDTVIPASAVEDGKQSFDVYLCGQR